MRRNPLTQLDFYKSDHRRQYPDGTTMVYSNLTPRSSKLSPIPEHLFDGNVVSFGLQFFIKDFLIDLYQKEFFSQPKADVVAAYKRRLDTSLGKDAVPVDHIEALHDLGYLPICIKALPEGSVSPIKVPVLVIYNTHPAFFWLTNSLETALSCYLWKPMTSATITRAYKKLFEKYAEDTGSDLDFVKFQGHDFSFRGLSGPQDAALSGAAHLLSFVGTDTVSAIDLIEDYYGGDATKELIGTSVPATEHSVMCMGGYDDEIATFRRLITELYPKGIVSIVSDTWDFWRVVTEYVSVLKDTILERDGKVVIRPDCYDEETSIMTSTGWKLFKDLTYNDKVAQVDLENGVTYINPLEIVKQDYEGDMYHFQDQKGKVDLLVTPNHRMVWELKIKNTLPYTKIQEAESSFVGLHYKRMFRSKENSNQMKALNWYERLLIAFQADGSYQSKHKNTVSVGEISGKLSLRFNFAKQRKIERLAWICENGEFEYSIRNEKARAGQSTVYVWVNKDEYISKSFDWVPQQESLCSNWSKEFIEELSNWDSCKRSDNRIKYDSTNKNAVLTVERIALAAGYGCLISEFKDTRKDIFSNVFTANILKDNRIGGQSITKTLETYKGKVYCVKVPTGMLLVKRNRATAISGNSGDPVKIICGEDIPIIFGVNLDEVKNIVKNELLQKVINETPYGVSGKEKTENLFRWNEKVYKAILQISWNKRGGRYYRYETELQSFEEVEPKAEQKGAIECLWDVFGGTVNGSGYKVLDPHVGLIYGDSITLPRAEAILEGMKAKGFASSNMVFGIGSFTYQYVTRDSFGFAVKSTYGEVNGIGREIYKDPKTDTGTKKSARGLLGVFPVIDDIEGNFHYMMVDQLKNIDPEGCQLCEVFRDGKLLIEDNIFDIRQRLNNPQKWII